MRQVVGEARPRLPTVCIATDDFSVRSETFVRRHLEELNCGHTVGLARKARVLGGSDKAVLHWPRRSFLRRVVRWSSLPIQDSFAVELDAFRRRNGVGILLAEFGTVGVELYEAARSIDLPMFCYFRGYDASKRLTNRGYRRRVGEMFRAIDGVVAVSQFLLDQLSDAGLRHPNTHVIPSGVDTEFFVPGEKDPDLVLFVGRLVPKKAPMAVLRSFAAVAHAHPTVRLEMVGDGPLETVLRREVDRLKLSHRVVLHGQRDHTHIQRLMAAASIYVQHSVTTPAGETEGAPTSLQEAMAAGAAIVASDHAGIPELVRDQVSGLLVTEGDEAGFTEALSALLEDQDLRLAITTAARSHAVSTLDYRVQYRRLEMALASALEARANRNGDC